MTPAFSPGLAALGLAGAAVFAARQALLFRLQRLAGPVYMSQIGSVAAVVGALLAVAHLGESLPSGFWPAAVPIALGAAAFPAGQRAETRGRNLRNRFRFSRRG